MGILEELDKRICGLIAESKDMQFTGYLRQLQGRLINQKYQADLLKEELDRNYRIYLQRNPQVSPVAGEQKPSVEEAVESVACVVSDGEASPGVEREMPRETVQEMPREQIAEAQEPVVQPQAYQQAHVVPVVQPQVMPHSKKTSGEFKVGAIILSMAGGIFILSALVMLGMHFMTGMLKGMCIYAACVVFFVFAEAFLYHRWQRLGTTVSAISIGGIYVSTLINYLSLRNFNMWVALGIVTAVTMFVIVWSRKREAASYRIIGMFACLVSFLFLDKGITSIDFLIITAIVAMVHFMSICIPVKKYGNGLQIVYAALNTLFTALMLARVQSFDLDGYTLVAFWASSLAVLHLLYVANTYRVHKQEHTGEAKPIGMLVTYGICAMFYIGMSMSLIELTYFIDITEFYAIIGAAAVISVVSWLALLKKAEKWASYYFLNAFLIMVSFSYMGNEVACYCLLGALVVAKLLSLCKSKALCASEAVITTLACMVGLEYYNEVSGVLLMAGVLVSVFFIHRWSTYYEIVITFSLAFFAKNFVPQLLNLPVFVGVLFIGVIAFNYVKRWRGKGIVVFNIMILAAQGLSMLALLNPIYRNAYITFLCMLVFGAATIVLVLQDKFGMATKWRNIILAVFLTYMAFIFKTNIPAINSALLMIIALICVGLGFAEDEKKVRIYGLVLSLLVCGKLALYDFFGTPTIQKTIIFLVVGVIALAIAAIYMVLEKRNDSRGGME